jgi:hypothetical protein
MKNENKKFLTGESARAMCSAESLEQVISNFYALISEQRASLCANTKLLVNLDGIISADIRGRATKLHLTSNPRLT